MDDNYSYDYPYEVPPVPPRANRQKNMQKPAVPRAARAPQPRKNPTPQQIKGTKHFLQLSLKNLLVLNERTKYFSLSQGRPRSKGVNFNEWIKLKKTIALLVLFSLVLAALISISVLYFLADCGELKLSFIY